MKGLDHGLCRELGSWLVNVVKGDTGSDIINEFDTVTDLEFRYSLLEPALGPRKYTLVLEVLNHDLVGQEEFWSNLKTCVKSLRAGMSSKIMPRCWWDKLGCSLKAKLACQAQQQHLQWGPALQLRQTSAWAGAGLGLQSSQQALAQIAPV